MKKKVFCITVVAVMLLSLTVGAFASNEPISVEIDNVEVQFNALSGEPFVDENGRTQVPLRCVMEQFGCKVEWDAASRMAILTKNGMKVIVPIGKKYIVVDGHTVEMDTEAIIRNGHTYLPIRSVLEAFGANVAWSEGRISVTSDPYGTYKKIFVDEEGHLIFELSNGNQINVGSLPAGEKGRDGVSVVDARVDANRDLIIKLSNGRTINAGSVGTGEDLDVLTFADYPIGTKFYLTQPTGQFHVDVKVDNTDYDVSIDEVYYELTKKNHFDDKGAWEYSEISGGSGQKYYSSMYNPYETTFYIGGKTSAELAGCMITLRFDDMHGKMRSEISCTMRIMLDGSFSGESVCTTLFEPKALYLTEVQMLSNGNAKDDAKLIAELLAQYAGTWQDPLMPEKTIIVNEDGTIVDNGSQYTPKYGLTYNDSLYAECDEWRINFYQNANGVIELRKSTDGISYYYQVGKWEAVELKTDNFYDYFRYIEVADFNYNSFGELEVVMVYSMYKLKDEYRMLFNVTGVAIKIQGNAYWGAYVVDTENETYEIVAPGEFKYATSDVVNMEYSGSFKVGTTVLYDEAGTTTYHQYELTDATGTLYIAKAAE